MNTVELGNNLIGFKYRNVTKYYENDIVFVQQPSHSVVGIPLEILDRVEGCIVHFDAKKVSDLEVNDRHRMRLTVYFSSATF